MGWVVNATPQPIYLRETEQLLTVQKAVWAPEPSEQVHKILPSTGLDHKTVQPLMSRYIDYAIQEY